jgi:hypothetical protein
MLRKRRKVMAVRSGEGFINDGREEKPIAVPCVEIPCHWNGQQDDTDSFEEELDDDQDERESASPCKTTTSPKAVIGTDPKRTNRGVKRGTFGSRTQNFLTDSELSKKIRAALTSQSSLSQVCSDDENPLQRKLAIHSLDDEHEATSAFLIQEASTKQSEKQVCSSQSSFHSNLTFHHVEIEVPRASSEELHPSLAAVRAFFAELDNVSLIMEDASRNPSAKKNYKLRTRRCKLPKRTLQSEYAKYCHACGQSVKPLSIQHFAEQRAQYFRRSEVFEGMFDE